MFHKNHVHVHVHVHMCVHDCNIVVRIIAIIIYNFLFPYSAPFAGSIQVLFGTFQVLFRDLPQLNMFTKYHRHDTPSGPIISINTTDFEDGGSGEVIQIFFKIPQIHQVLFRYLPEVTAPKNSFPRAPTRDKPGEPIKSAPTFEEVL